MARSTRETIIEWATAAKMQAEDADLDPMPSDERFIRAAVAFNMLTCGPHPAMIIVSNAVMPEAFNRSSAIVSMAIAFDDDPPSTPERAALFKEVLRG